MCVRSIGGLTWAGHGVAVAVVVLLLQMGLVVDGVHHVRSLLTHPPAMHTPRPTTQRRGHRERLAARSR